MGKLKAMPPKVSAMPPRIAQLPKQAEGFYTSPEWRAAAARAKRRAGHRCEVTGCETPTDRLIADHIVERKDGGSDFDPSNLQVLCFTHHQRKTAEARRRRALGQGLGAADTASERAAAPPKPAGARTC